MGGVLRFWDRCAARRADAYIAVARNVRDRIRSTYGVDADIVYPPVDVTRFRPEPRGGRILTISRLLPYKRIDLIVKAATRIGIPLDVVGDGPLFSPLRAIAGPSVEFHGMVTDDVLLELIQGCSAVCMPGFEDFGIVAVEGNAAGKPAIALAAGGALETIEDGINGVLFAEPTVESLVAAIHRLEAIDTSPEEAARLAERFSVPRFRHELVCAVERAIERKSGSVIPGK
jgi:glycosyltransferase involved in cell wall biosynthesis